MARRVYLYAFDEVARIIDVKYLEGEAISIRSIRKLADWMRNMCPGNVRIYCIDNRIGLYKSFMESVKTKDFTKNIEFADTVSKEGLLIE